MHIIHNLEGPYDGVIRSNEDFGNVHGLNRDWFSWGNHDVAMSKGAITCADQWATVSRTYKEDLLRDNKYKDILRQKP